MTTTPATSKWTSARRTLPGASIVKVSVGPMNNNAYLVTCSRTGESLLIDAANGADTPWPRGGPRSRPERVVDPDHASALRPLAGAGGARRGDRRATAATHWMSPCRSPRTDCSPVATPSPWVISKFDVIHLRGHYPGSVALALSGEATGGVTQLFHR